MKIDISYTTAIPSPAVKLFGAGSGFNGGRKSTLEVRMDLSQNGTEAFALRTRTWGSTQRYDAADLEDVAGKPGWWKAIRSGATATETGTLSVKDSNLRAEYVSSPEGSHSVRLVVAGGNPLISPSPEIDGNFIISFRREQGSWQAKLTGVFDGFPDHRVTVGGLTLLDHDCVAEGQTPLSLPAPAEFSKDSGWNAL
jgi:hypothetical protein